MKESVSNTKGKSELKENTRNSYIFKKVFFLFCMYKMVKISKTT